jgi:hypothetical protein
MTGGDTFRNGPAKQKPVFKLLLSSVGGPLGGWGVGGVCLYLALERERV